MGLEILDSVYCYRYSGFCIRKMGRGDKSAPLITISSNRGSIRTCKRSIYCYLMLMNFKVLLTAILLVLTPVSAAFGLQCEKAFQLSKASPQETIQRISESQSTFDKVNFGYNELRILQKVPLPSGAYWSTEIYSSIRDPQSFLKIHVSQMKNIQDSNEISLLDPNHPVYQNVYGTALFTIENYGRRAWSGDFKEGLIKDNFKYSASSIYITVRESVGLADKIIGNLKLVLADANKGELLPVEKKLGMTLPDNAGLKVEPSNFAIEKEFSLPVFSEILVQFVRYAKTVASRPDHQKNKNVFYTYADEISLRLYEPMGFKKMSAEPILYEGTKWWILGATAESLSDISGIIQRIRQSWPQSYVEGLSRKVHVLTDVRPSSHFARRSVFLQNGREVIVHAEPLRTGHATVSSKVLFEISVDGRRAAMFLLDTARLNVDSSQQSQLVADYPFDRNGVMVPQKVVYQNGQIEIETTLNSGPFRVKINLQGLP